MANTGPPKVGKRPSGPPKIGGPPKLGAILSKPRVCRPAPPMLGKVTFKKKRVEDREPWTPAKKLPPGPPYIMPGQKLGETAEDWKASPLGVAWAKAQKRFKETRVDQIIYCNDAKKASYHVMDFGQFLDDKRLRFVMYRIAVIQKAGNIGAPYVCDD